MNSDPASRPEKPKGEGRGRPNGGSGNLPQRAVRRRDAKGASNAPAEPTVGPEGSPGLRDRLLGEINELGSTDDAADWAHRSLRAKNTLRAADAECVEEAFAAKLVTLTGHAAEEPAIQRAASEQLTKAHLRDAHGRGRRPAAQRIDKTILGLPEPRRVRDRDHVKSVAKQACLVCGRRPADAHHLRFAQSRALSRKVSDEFTVPLCVSGTPSRGTSLRRRDYVVAECRHRSDGKCALPLVGKPSASGAVEVESD